MADPTITDKAETAAVIEKRFPGGRCLCSSQDPCPCSGQLVRYCPCYRDEAARLVATTNEVVEPTTPGPIPGVDPTTKAKLDAIEVDLRGGYVRSGEHIAEDPDEFRHEQFVNVADLPSIIHAWALAAVPHLADQCTGYRLVAGTRTWLCDVCDAPVTVMVGPPLTNEPCGHTGSREIQPADRGTETAARPRLESGDVPITERTPHGVWIADGPDPERADPECGGLLSGCADCRAYDALRQHLVEQIMLMDQLRQDELRDEVGKREALMEMVAARDTLITELRQECDTLLTRLNEAHATAERLAAEKSAETAALRAERRKQAQAIMDRLDTDIVLSLAQWLHVNGGCEEPGDCEECYPLAQRMALVANRAYGGTWESESAASLGRGQA